MKYSLILIMTFALSHTNAQLSLYNESGVKLSYNATVVKTVFCDQEKKNVYFIKVRWTLSNNSGKPLYISASCYLQLGAPGCLAQDEVARNGYQPLRTNYDGTLDSGDDILGEDGNWFYEREIVPYWTLTAKPLWNVPKPNTTNETTSTSAKKKSQPTYGISQTGDVINNPKVPSATISQRSQEADAAATRELGLQKGKQQNEDALKLRAEQNVQEDLRLAREKKNRELRDELAQSQQVYENKIAATNRMTTDLTNSLTGLIDNIYGIVERNKARRAEVFEGFVSGYVNNQYEKKTQIPYYEKRDLTPELQQLPLEKLRAQSSISAQLKEGDVSPYTDVIVSSLKLAISKDALIEIIPDGVKRSIKLHYKLMSISYSKDFLSLNTLMFFTVFKKDGSMEHEGNFNTVWNNTVFKFEDINEIKFFPESVKYADGAKITQFPHYEILLRTGESYPFTGSPYAQKEIIELKRYLGDLKKDNEAEKEKDDKVSPVAIESRQEMIETKLAYLKNEYANVVLLNQKNDLQNGEINGRVRCIRSTSYNVTNSTSGQTLREKSYSYVMRYNEKGYMTSREEYSYHKEDVEVTKFVYNKYNTLLLGYDSVSNIITQEFVYTKLLAGGYQQKRIFHLDELDVFQISDNSDLKLDYSIDYNDTAKLFSKTTYIYNKTNQLLATESEGHDVSTLSFSYNLKGQKIKEVKRNDKGEVDEVWEYKYDPKGKLLEEIFPMNGKVYRIAFEKWDSRGNCIRDKTYLDGEMTSVAEVEYEYY